MKLSSKGRYAILAMLHLAVNDREGPTPLTELCKSLGISLSYIEQLFARLRAGGLVKGTRGPGGGYRLTPQAHETSMAEIYGLFESSTDKHGGEEQDGLPYALWQALSRQIFEYLDDISFGTFLEEHLPAVATASATGSVDRSAA